VPRWLISADVATILRDPDATWQIGASHETIVVPAETGLRQITERGSSCRRKGRSHKSLCVEYHVRLLPRSDVVPLYPGRPGMLAVTKGEEIARCP
jgi:hypothetical protein